MADRLSDCEIFEETACCRARDGLGHDALEYIRVEIVDDDPLKQHDAEEQNDWRNINASSVGQKISDRPEQRLREPQKQVPHGPNEVVADVHDAKRDQPGENRPRHYDQLVKVERIDDDIEDCPHVIPYAPYLPASAQEAASTRTPQPESVDMKRTRT